MGAYLARGGGGSSRLGKLDAACFRAVKLEGAPIGSIFDDIPGCCITAVILYSCRPSRLTESPS